MRTIGDLRRMDGKWFEDHMGSWGPHVRELIHGIDHRPVQTDDEAKSIGHEQTFGVDLVDADHVRDVLLEQSEAVGARVRRHGLHAQCVTVKIRFGDFQTITRSRTLDSPTDLSKVIYEAARDLFDAWARDHFQPVRLIGVQTSHFTRETQLGLFDQPRQERERRVDRALDQIKQKFGSDMIGRGRNKAAD
jgi:DNA polymerase-4